MPIVILTYGKAVTFALMPSGVTMLIHHAWFCLEKNHGIKGKPMRLILRIIFRSLADLVHNRFFIAFCLIGFYLAIMGLLFGIYMFTKDRSVIDDPELKKQVEAMSTQEKVEQMIVTGAPAWTDKPENEATAADYQKSTKLSKEQRKAFTDHQYGGVFLMASNLDNVEQTVRLNWDLVSTSPIPMFIMVEHEGGAVSGIPFATQMPGNMAMGAIFHPATTKEMATVLAKEMHALGFNINLAPELDIASDSDDGEIDTRSFSDTPRNESEQGASYIYGMQNENVAPAVGFFPGIQHARIDSKTGLSISDRTINDMSHSELIPFRQAVEAKAQIIVAGYTAYPQIEKGTYISKKTGEAIPLPAMMSSKILENQLRGHMGFEGLIAAPVVSDGIYDNYDRYDVAKLCINAGCNILFSPFVLTSRESIADADTYVATVAAMVDRGEIDKKKVDESVMRILWLKKTNEMYTNYETPVDEAVEYAKKNVANERNQKDEWDITCQAITLIKNNDTLPIGHVENEKIAILYQHDDQEVQCQITESKLQDYNTFAKGVSLSHLNYEKASEAELEKALKGVGDVIVLTDTEIYRDLESYDETYFNQKEKAKAHVRRVSNVIKTAHNHGAKVTVIVTALPYEASYYINDADAVICSYNSTGVVQEKDVSKQQGDQKNSDSNDQGTMEIKKKDKQGNEQKNALEEAKNILVDKINEKILNNAQNVAEYSFGPNTPVALYTAFGSNTPYGKLPVTLHKTDQNGKITDEVLFETGFGLQGYDDRRTGPDAN